MVFLRFFVGAGGQKKEILEAAWSAAAPADRQSWQAAVPLYKFLVHVS